jgi:hypothetical protein
VWGLWVHQKGIRTEYEYFQWKKIIAKGLDYRIMERRALFSVSGIVGICYLSSILLS